jgi:flagellar basal body P-ring formation protein FlgA
MKQSTTVLIALVIMLTPPGASAEAPIAPEAITLNENLAAPNDAPVAIKARRHLRAGTILRRTDVIIGDGETAQAAAQDVIGMEVKRTIYADKAIMPEDISPPTAIKRNAIVTIEFKKGPLLITTEARVLEPGSVGESVRVMNLSSKVILTAIVVSSSKVRTR